MKTIKSLAIIGAIVCMGSCVSTAKFPISQFVPAADITAKKKQDKHNNYLIEITAYHLAEASRLIPPKNNYIVWIVVDNGMTKNIGQLKAKNKKKSILKTTTPFNVKQIFLTAEDRGDLTYPLGLEISRTTFNK